MIVLALDLGTKCGYALGDSDYPLRVTASGVADCQPRRFESSGMRLIRLGLFLRETFAAFSPQHVVVEEVRRHVGVDAAHVYGAILGHVHHFCEQREPKVSYHGVPVATIKKYATGRGNAGKPDMIEAVRAWGFRPVDDNEADAIALLRCVLHDFKR